MQDVWIVYLAQRFFYRVADFFHHWYADGSRAFGRRFMAMITRADRTLAIAITLRHFFEPLYKDYTIIGRILGVFFRTFRILIGAALYLVMIAAFLVVYLIWLAIPAIILFYAARHL